MYNDKILDVLVIGAGQAGLGAGYYLKRNNKNFMIVDGGERVGDTWRKRWDSLRLFTPRPFASLPGMKVPNSYGYYPTKDEIADYFENYALTNELPVRMNVKVSALKKTKGVFVSITNVGEIYAHNVIIAAGPYRTPFIPSCSSKLDKRIAQIHSYHYKNPNDMQPTDILIVGGGNSGAQLAVELYEKGHKVTIATSGEPWFLPAKILGVSLYWYIKITGVLDSKKDSWISRYVRKRGDGIVGKELSHLIDQHKVTLIPYRLEECAGNRFTFTNGQTITADGVVWATGFEPDYRWIKIVAGLDKRGLPKHAGGISPVKGLFWLGLPWQTRLNSAIINGISLDAKKTIDTIR